MHLHMQVCKCITILSLVTNFRYFNFTSIRIIDINLINGKTFPNIGYRNEKKTVELYFQFRIWILLF